MFGSLLFSVERVHPFAAANVIDDYLTESRSRTYVEDSASPLNLSTASASLSPVGGGGPPIDYFSGRGEIAVHQKLPVRADKAYTIVRVLERKHDSVVDEEDTEAAIGLEVLTEVTGGAARLADLVPFQHRAAV